MHSKDEKKRRRESCREGLCSWSRDPLPLSWHRAQSRPWPGAEMAGGTPAGGGGRGVWEMGEEEEAETAGKATRDIPPPSMGGRWEGMHWETLVSFCAGCCTDIFPPSLPTPYFPPIWHHSEVTFLTENNERNRSCSNRSRGCVDQNKSRPAVKALGPEGSALPEGRSSVARCHGKCRLQSQLLNWEKKA